MQGKSFIGEHLLFIVHIIILSRSRSEISGFTEYVKIETEVTSESVLSIFGYNKCIGLLRKVYVYNTYTSGKSLM